MRESHEFFEVCRTPELASEVTLQPIERYTGLLDASIIFSDILVIPQAMGMEVQMNPGPYFPHPLDTPTDVEKLASVVNVDKELDYVFQAITRTRKCLGGEVPLIGFCGAPWTLFGYMIEGGGSKTYQKAKTWLFKYPEESKALLAKIADVCVDFLVGQVKAGAQVCTLLLIINYPVDFPHVASPSLRFHGGGVVATRFFHFFISISEIYFHKCPTPTGGGQPTSNTYDTFHKGCQSCS